MSRPITTISDLRTEIRSLEILKSEHEVYFKQGLSTRQKTFSIMFTLINELTDKDEKGDASIMNNIISKVLTLLSPASVNNFVLKNAGILPGSVIKFITRKYGKKSK